MAEHKYPEEQVYLSETLRCLEEALQKAKAAVDRIDREYMDTKRYMAEYRGELDPHEMFQNELELKRIDQSGVFSVRVWQQLVRLQDSPYFGRIDFQMDEYEEDVSYYIGRFSFQHNRQMMVYDWRAPLSSLFYEGEIGPARYQAPAGLVEGELLRRRQYKIQEGRLAYTIESTVNIRDEVLQKELSHNSDEKMRSIISTIQKEQNQIIRNERSGVMVIQGVAGSGKTSVALHRIAYLLYRSRDRLTSKNIMILSPNRVFSDYISNILPELGEEPVFEWSFAELAEVQLERVIHFENDRPLLETDDQAWAERVRFKSTVLFFRQLEEYLGQMTETIFVPGEYQSGQKIITAEWLRKRYLAYGNYPVKRRLKMAAADILERLDTDNYMEEELPTAAAIERKLKNMLRKQNTLDLYRDFYQWLERPELFVMPAKKTLEWSDVFPFLYLYAAFEGVADSQVIKHLIVDEMQDYTPIQYAVLNRLFPCSKTILGDYGQSLNPYHQFRLEDVYTVYPEAERVYLNKSYRSTFEIISFAGKVKSDSLLEAVERHGDAPLIHHCSDQKAQISMIISELESFKQSSYVSLGIIMKTNLAAETLYADLTEVADVHLIRPDSAEFRTGISVTSVQMSKGLEYDAVILPCCDTLTYCSENDRNLLYIGITRAMHRLTLYYSGELTKLIEGGYSGVKGWG